MQRTEDRISSKLVSLIIQPACLIICSSLAILYHPLFCLRESERNSCPGILIDIQATIHVWMFVLQASHEPSLLLMLLSEICSAKWPYALNCYHG